MATFAISKVCSAFEPSPVGSKVVDSAAFMEALEEGLRNHDVSGDRVKGQHFIVLPKEAFASVSAGDGEKPAEANLADYISCIHRGKVIPFLRREFAGEVNFLAVSVYSREAYFADPQVDENEDVGDCTHVIVTVIASSGPEAPLTADRFVANLAGGNREALLWSADEIREKATGIDEYWKQYSVVAG